MLHWRKQEARGGLATKNFSSHTFHEVFRDYHMRALLQRVNRSSVTVDGQVVGTIGYGFLVLLGIGQGDSEAQVQTLADKIVHLRVFEDDEGKMNRSLLDIGGEALVVSQFTLYADARKGRRPSFTSAASPALAEHLVERFKETLAGYGLKVESGIFGAHMDVELINTTPSNWCIWCYSATPCCA